MKQDQANSPKPGREFEISVDVREISCELATSLCTLREQWLCKDPFAPENKWGSLYGTLTASGLLERHKNDPGSRFTLATAPDGNLIGYIRYRLPNTPGDSAELILIVVDREHLKRDRQDSEPSVAASLMQSTLKEVAHKGAGSIFADICAAPVPNEASVRLHLSHGFKFDGDGTPITRHFEKIGEVTINFHRYTRGLSGEDFA